MGIRSMWAAGALATTAVVAGCGGGSGTKTLSQEDLIAKVKPTVVELSGKSGEQTQGGSGVVIDAKRDWC